MTTTLHKLFEIHLEHIYFANKNFTGFTISPTKESHALFDKYGLVLSEKPGSCTIFFVNPFEGINRDRKSVLQIIDKLQFIVNISDPLFRNYTGNIDINLDKKTLWLTNFDEQLQALRTSNLLHMSEFVSENDVKPIPDTLHCFGIIEISMGVSLQEDLYIRFLNRSIHWRYIVANKNVQKLEKLAILGEGNKRLFAEPEEVDLTDGSKGFAFTSNEPVAITQRPNERFDLVSNYDENSNHIKSILIKGLPTPDLSSLSSLNIIDAYVYI